MATTLEITILNNLITLFGGDFTLLALFCIGYFVILVSFFKLPTAFSIPIMIFFTAIFFFAIPEMITVVVIISAFIIGGFVMKFLRGG